MFVKKKGDRVLYLLLWMDDILMGCNDAEMRGQFMKAFSARFRVKGLGLLTQGLGSSIVQDLTAGTVKLSLTRTSETWRESLTWMKTSRGQIYQYR